MFGLKLPISCMLDRSISRYATEAQDTDFGEFRLFYFWKMEGSTSVILKLRRSTAEFVSRTACWLFGTSL